MKTYTVRLAITNSATPQVKGKALSIWYSWDDAKAESQRLFTEKGIESYVTTN